MVTRFTRIVTYLALCSGALVFSCASPPNAPTEGPVWRDKDTAPIPEPEFSEPSLVWISFKRSGPEQLRELLDVDRNLRKLVGAPTQAKNTNSFDEVPNSSWFTNRHGYPATRLSADEIRAGLSITAGPDVSNSWKVFRPKLGGATPGFWIEDSRGDQYLIKFDPPGHPEMATAAAAMGSRYFYACGYNVPQESIVYWKPEMLHIREGATAKLPDGTRRPLTLDDIETMLEGVHRAPDGTIRSLASLNLGNVKGPYMYDGVNKNDRNDWCPHQHRRELRALQVIGSLINHYDLKDHNSMDVYVGEPGAGYLKHFLMDFGSTFGADGRSAKHPRKGYANIFDLRDVLVSTATAGIKTWAWEDAQDYRYPSIGYFEADLFEPQKFDPIIPNPAFEQMTNQDGYWGAKTVMAFDSADLGALVDAGALSNTEAKAYLLKTLKERQEKIGRYWFSKVNPVDYPRLAITDTSVALKFTDLWIAAHLGSQSSHEFTVRFRGQKVIDRRLTDGDVVLLMENDLRRMRELVSERSGQEASGHFEILVFSTRDGQPWKMPAKFTLLLGASADQSRIVSIEHPD